MPRGVTDDCWSKPRVENGIAASASLVQSGPVRKAKTTINNCIAIRDNNKKKITECSTCYLTWRLSRPCCSVLMTLFTGGFWLYALFSQSNKKDYPLIFTRTTATAYNWAQLNLVVLPLEHCAGSRATIKAGSSCCLFVGSKLDKRKTLHNLYNRNQISRVVGLTTN